MENTDGRLKNIEKELVSTNKELSQIDIETDLEKLKQKINEVLKVELTIA